MRCPDCNKFASLELGEEPEAELEASEGVVTGTVRLVRTCADCGTELKESTFEVEVTIPELVEHVQKHTDDRADKDKAYADAVKAAQAAGTPEPEDDDDDEEHEQEVEVDSSESTEEGGGRYKKSFYGIHVSFTVTCSCKFECSGDFEDKIAASHMDEIA